MSDNLTPPQSGDAESQQERLADLLRRRADVYNPKRERTPYYGDDDIDLLRAMLDAALAALAASQEEVVRLREALSGAVRRLESNAHTLGENAAILEAARAELARLRTPTATGEDQQRAREIFEDAICEAPEDVFNDPDGNWSYHVSIIFGEAITAARVQGVREERERWLDCAQLDATMEGPKLKGWNRSALDRLWRALTARGPQKPE